MVDLTPQEIREHILQIAEHHRPKRAGGGSLQFNTIRMDLKERLGARLSHELQQEILSQWHELVRTGYFAPGANLDNENLPFFHITQRGARAIEQLSRDPANIEGYLRYLGAHAPLNEIASSYLKEGLECYAATLYKAAAVMIGAASESLILELRDAVLAKTSESKIAVPKELSDWRVKVVLDGLYKFLDGRKSGFQKELREQFEAYFLAFAQQIRAGRNDAGHPSSVEPVTEQSIHASFLIFPELARLARSLLDWTEASCGMI